MEKMNVERNLSVSSGHIYIDYTFKWNLVNCWQMGETNAVLERTEITTNRQTNSQQQKQPKMLTVFGKHISSLKVQDHVINYDWLLQDNSYCPG